MESEYDSGDTSSRVDFDDIPSTSQDTRGRKKRISRKWISFPLIINHRITQKTDHKHHFFVDFNHFLSDKNVFAVCGGTSLSIYQCLNKDKNRFRQLLSLCDVKDSFYSCAWTLSPEKHCWVICAGLRGIIRVYSTQTGDCVNSIAAHGGAINEIKVHHTDLFLLLTASQDHTVKLWNIYTNVLVAIFAGSDGHKSEVISIDFNLTHPVIVSGGLDYAIKVWHLDKSVQSNIEKSKTFDSDVEQVTMKPVFSHFPVYSNRDVHINYVDSVLWSENLIVSKATHEDIVIWKIGDVHTSIEDVLAMTPSDQAKLDFFIIKRFPVKGNESWFVRFGIDWERRFLCLGSMYARMFYVLDLFHEHDDINKWKLVEVEVTEIQRHKLSVPLRHFAFNLSGNILIGVADDGLIMAYDVTHKSQ